MENLDARRARWIRARMGLLCGCMAIGLGLIVSSAYTLQVEYGSKWLGMAEKQRQRRLHVVPKRGTVYDRNGTPLAVTVEVPSVSLDPAETVNGFKDSRTALHSIPEVAAALGRVLAIDPLEIDRRIDPHRRFVWLKRRITKEEVDAVRQLTDPKQPAFRGLSIEGEGHRFYPNREVAGPLLGFVSPDGEGKDGLELELDEELKGHVEQVRGFRDRSGQLMFSDGIGDEQAFAGHNVYLTIDQGIQYTAEQELDAAVRTHEANGGSVVVLDPNTGEILALANAPGYNPNDYASSEVQSRRNRAIADRFEPGSTMKVFTVAAGLAARTLSPTQTLYCEDGTMAIDNVVIHDTHHNGLLTPTQVLALSSNIGAAKIGMTLGETQLHDAFRRFGFGESTGIPLPGETAGVLRPRSRPWVPVETAVASFGQGIGVTTIQLAMGVSAIANGGRLLEPVLIKKVTDGAGALVRDGVPHVRREAIPGPVARMVAEMMVAVTEGEGTGVEAAIPGYRVAGKTGTAQKADPATGKYTTDRFTSLFVGFVPAERPRLAIAVVLDEPAVARAGGFVAAPTFRRIAEMSLRYLGVTPKGTHEVALAKVGGEREHAAAALEALRRDRPEAFTFDSPAAAASPSASSSSVPLGPSSAAVASAVPSIRVPDMRGWSAREAVKASVGLGLFPAIDGTGSLVRQEPAPGTAVPKGATIKLRFDPPT